jgi:Fur family transcriptional regulator, peroxide stress response regulator
MHFTAAEIAAKLEQFTARLRAAGVKATHQRLEIYREVLSSGEHPDADAVFRGVRQRVPTVSPDTVYRTLWLLADLGLIGMLGQPRERVRFDANTAPHHHFVCTACGEALDFTSAEFDALAVPAAAAQLGQVRQAHVELRGVCNRCVISGEPVAARR